MANSTSIPEVVFSLETWVRIGVELPITVFAMSLVICLLVQFLRKNENVKISFFRIYSVLAFCECGSNLGVIFILHLPNSGLFTEFYFTYQRWLCGVVYPLGAYFIRVSFIGQNFLAINRFTAMFFPMKHEKIWSKRNTALVIGFCLTLAFILQSHVFLATNPKYTSGFGGCSYGYFGDFNLDTYASKTQSATVEFTAVFCTVLLFLTLIKLNMLYRQGAISSQHKKDLPLLVNAIVLNTEMVILGVCYYMNSVVILTGGSWSNIIYGWTIFVYMQTPSILLFLTSKKLRTCYWKFIWPVKTSPKPRKAKQTITVMPTTNTFGRLPNGL